MGIFAKLGQLIGVVPPEYTDEEYRQYHDGFATGFPLMGQPERPVHNTAAYRRGLRLGKQKFNSLGRPQINSESEGGEDE